MRPSFLVRFLLVAMIFVCVTPLAIAQSKTKPRVKPRARPVAAVRTYAIEKEGSEIGFLVKTRLKKVEGVFENWTAKLTLDPAKLDTLNLALTVDAASVKTGVSLEENQMKSENFFAVEQYPEIALVSKKVTDGGSGQCQMEAEFVLHGSTKLLSIPLTLELSPGAAGQLKGEFEFSRKDFGITHNMFLNPIEDVVKVSLNFRVREQTLPAKDASVPKAKK